MTPTSSRRRQSSVVLANVMFTCSVVCLSQALGVAGESGGMKSKTLFNGYINSKISKVVTAYDTPTEKIAQKTYHTPPRALITTMTIIFGIFGFILMAALAVLFVHFFVMDLSDYILCCFHKHRQDPRMLSLSSPTSSCFRNRRCGTPYFWCRQEQAVAPCANRRHVYRPNVAAVGSAAGVPACLNFRRRSDPSAYLFGEEVTVDPVPNSRRLHDRRQIAGGQQQIFSVSPPPQHRAQNQARIGRRHNRRSTNFLSSIYANSVFLSDEHSPYNGFIDAISLQVCQPPSYDDAVATSSFDPSSLPDGLLATTAQSSSLFSWNNLPPPPAYTEVTPTGSSTARIAVANDSGVSSSHDDQVLVSNAADSNVQLQRRLADNQQRTDSVNASDGDTAGPPTTTSDSTNEQPNHAFSNPTYISINSSGLRPYGVNVKSVRALQGHQQSSEDISRSTVDLAAQYYENIFPRNSSVHEDPSTSTVYDITHVYSWHV